VATNRPEASGRIAHWALRGANLLDKAADKLVTSGWVETGFVVLLVGRAVWHGHRLAKKARLDRQKG
jgi:hypothetical protein